MNIISEKSREILFAEINEADAAITKGGATVARAAASAFAAGPNSAFTFTQAITSATDNGGNNALSAFTHESGSSSTSEASAN